MRPICQIALHVSVEDEELGPGRVQVTQQWDGVCAFPQPTIPPRNA